MTVETFLDGKVRLYCGDCRAVLDQLEENSVDSIVCDPPYHLLSIVKRFGGNQAAAKDYSDVREDATGAFGRASRGFMGKQWDGGDVAFQSETWARALRVLKPGGYILAFSSSRTFGRMSVAIEDAGFITHPMIGWIFGQGFPKAHRVRAEGWAGWRYGGQSLKPALEPIYMGQKPFSEINGTANILRWGTGAVNIDACRVESEGGVERVGEPSQDQRYTHAGATNFSAKPGPRGGGAAGRWPANVMTDGSPEVFAAFPDSDGQLAAVGPQHGGQSTANVYGEYVKRASTEPRGDSGSAARFFWASKAASDDRLGSNHPTVKPVDLIEELVTLVTPPGGTVLDCFAGTGTTGEAAWRRGFNAILIEREEEYQNDIRRRVRLCMAGPDERRRESIKAKGREKPFEEGTLFSEAGQ